ncbi:MAG: toprim domain-containing protein [Brachymonas sp.]|nr:toprim domain-containing protein [Brachymonas sp.]
MAALAASQEIIVCEAIIDALTFWCAGFRNVTTAYGVEGFTDELLQALKSHGVRRILIAYDRDEAGDRAADKLAPKLMSEGFECYRILFPKGMDANEYTLKVQPAAKSLGLLIRKAQWLGKGEKPSREHVSVHEPVQDEKPWPLNDPAPDLALMQDAHLEGALAGSTSIYAQELQAKQASSRHIHCASSYEIIVN